MLTISRRSGRAGVGRHRSLALGRRGPGCRHGHACGRADIEFSPTLDRRPLGDFHQQNTTGSLSAVLVFPVTSLPRTSSMTATARSTPADADAGSAAMAVIPPASSRVDTQTYTRLPHSH